MTLTRWRMNAFTPCCTVPKCVCMCVCVHIDAMNLCLSLTTQGFEDTAFTVLKTFPGLQTELQDGEALNMGNFFLRHCVNMDKVRTHARY